MNGAEQEIDVLRGDIQMLNELIDRALDKGNVDDPHLHACAQLLHLRRKRLADLENITLYTSRGDDAE